MSRRQVNDLVEQIVQCLSDDYDEDGLRNFIDSFRESATAPEGEDAFWETFVEPMLDKVGHWYGREHCIAIVTVPGSDVGITLHGGLPVRRDADGVWDNLSGVTA